MTDHAERDLLLDLAYGELSDREARRVSEHVAGCASCRAELERLQGTRQLMAALPEVPAPERGERVLLAAAREAAERARPARLLPRWLVPTVALAATVAVVSVVSLREAPRLAVPAERSRAVMEPAPTAPAPPAAQLRTAPPRTAPLGEEPREYAAAPPAAAGPAAPAPPPRAAAPRRERALAKPAPSQPASPEAEVDAGLAEAPGSRDEQGAPDEEERVAAEARAADALSDAPAPVAAPAPRYAAEKRAATGAAAAAPAPLVRTFSGCPGESRREVRLDAGGRVVRYVRDGVAGGRRVRVELDFDGEGRVSAARARDAETGAPVPADVLPGLPRSAAQVDPDAPPNCGP